MCTSMVAQCIYVRSPIYAHTYMEALLYMHVHMWKCFHICVCLYMRVHIWKRFHIFVCPYMHICTYLEAQCIYIAPMYMHAHIHKKIRICALFVYVCKYESTFVYACFSYMRVHIQKCICIFSHINISNFVYVYTYTKSLLYMRAHIWKHFCICTQAQKHNAYIEVCLYIRAPYEVPSPLWYNGLARVYNLRFNSYGWVENWSLAITFSTWLQI